jgi:hypothetical protein
MDYLTLTRTQVPWDDNWKLDEKFFKDLDAWKDRHPDSTLSKVMENINDAVTKNLSFAKLVPDAPFPARSIVKALAHLLALGVVCVPFLLSTRHMSFLWFCFVKESSKDEEGGV